MSRYFQVEPIAYIRTGFSDKFGIPRQSGLVADSRATIVFYPKYRNSEALRGLEGYSHLWLIWFFSEAQNEKWSPTVRPPKLGGNKRMGVFATRSPYRPNSLGLSSVKIEKIDFHSSEGPRIQVLGADLLDDTPILDIKPYLAYTDSHPDAMSGFAFKEGEGLLKVKIESALAEQIPGDIKETVLNILAQDPRPGYQDDPSRLYKLDYDNISLGFTVTQGELTVKSVCRKDIEV